MTIMCLFCEDEKTHKGSLNIAAFVILMQSLLLSFLADFLCNRCKIFMQFPACFLQYMNDSISE